MERTETPFTLSDLAEEFPAPEQVVTGKVVLNRGLEIELSGYGCCADLTGSPIYLEVYEGQLRLLVWSDINQEDPTHIIDLAGARVDRLKEDAPGEVSADAG